jgi:hypothetical protein
VAVNGAIAITFSEAVDPATVSVSSVTLSGPAGLLTGSVNYTGTTATFTPSADLAYDTTYTVTVVGSVSDLAGNAMGGSYSLSFTTGPAPDLTAPQVSNSSPANDATSVAVNTAVNATFSEAMNAASIGAASFTLAGPGGAVAGSVSYSGFTATFSPQAALAYNTTYTATITTAAQDLAGNALAANHAWNFTTGAAPDTTAPQVSNVNPSNNATGIQTNSAVSVTFSEAMNPATVTTAQFTLAKQGMFGNSPVTGAVNYSGITATFTPSTALDYDSTYIATLTTGAQDLAGNALAADYTWQFTTGAAPDTIPPQVSSTNPATDATEVAVNSAVTATFSEAMDPTTITTSTFMVMDILLITPPPCLVGHPCGASGAVTYSGNTATFTPSTNLNYSTPYQATITTGAKDTAGNALVSSYNWTFTTGPAPDTTPPTVDSTIPVSSATSVSVGSNITVIFSETMDQGTISTTSFTLSASGTPVAGAVAAVHNAGTGRTEGSFTPSAPLAYSTTYTATITTAVTDSAGNPLASDYVWTFTTEAAPDTTNPTVTGTNPGMGQIVDPNSTVSATFSETMNGGTLNATTFTLTGPSGAVAGNVSYSALTATFSPTNPLSFNTSYSATVTTGAQDVAGNGLASNYAWSFTTRDRVWGTAQLIETDNAGNAYNPQIALDASGNAIAVWKQYDGARDNIWANRYTAGSGWGSAQLIETDAGWALGPQIAFDSNGNAIAVWQQYDGTRYNIWANRYTAGSGWGSAQLIETDAGWAGDPQIAFDSNGNAIAVWYQSDGARNNIWAKRFE